MDIILQILYTVLVLGLLVTVHEFGHFIVAKKTGVRVLEFAIGMGPAIFKKQGKETLFSIRILPIGGYCKMEGEDEDSSDPGAFCNKPVWKRILVVVAGAAMNLAIAVIITFCLVLSEQNLPSVTVAQFYDDNVSSSYGLEVGDKIVDIDGKAVNIYTDISGAFSRTYGKESVDVTVLRDGEKVLLEDVRFPLVSINDELSSIVPDFYVAAEKKTVGSVLHHTFFRSVSYVTMMYESLFDMITGRASIKYVSGPIGTSAVIAEAASEGLASLAYLVALISINLCVINLLPLPALDGGRLVFLIIEGIRRKPLNRDVEGIIHLIGMGLLLLLTVVIAFKDIFFPVY